VCLCPQRGSAQHVKPFIPLSPSTLSSCVSAGPHHQRRGGSEQAGKKTDAVLSQPHTQAENDTRPSGTHTQAGDDARPCETSQPHPPAAYGTGLSQPHTPAGYSTGLSQPHTPAGYGTGGSQPHTQAGYGTGGSQPHTQAGYGTGLSQPHTPAGYGIGGSQPHTQAEGVATAAGYSTDTDTHGDPTGVLSTQGPDAVSDLGFVSSPADARARGTERRGVKGSGDGRMKGGRGSAWNVNVAHLNRLVVDLPVEAVRLMTLAYQVKRGDLERQCTWLCRQVRPHIRCGTGIPLVGGASVEANTEGRVAASEKIPVRCTVRYGMGRNGTFTVWYSMVRPYVRRVGQNHIYTVYIR